MRHRASILLILRCAALAAGTTLALAGAPLLLPQPPAGGGKERYASMLRDGHLWTCSPAWSTPLSEAVVWTRVFEQDGMWPEFGAYSAGSEANWQAELAAMQRESARLAPPAPDWAAPAEAEARVKAVRCAAVGWPVRTWRHARPIEGRSEREDPRWGEPLGAWRPIWLPLSGSLLGWAAVWAFALEAPGAVRAFLRRRRGACPSCGYDLRAGGLARCPECGRASRDARASSPRLH